MEIQEKTMRRVIATRRITARIWTKRARASILAS